MTGMRKRRARPLLLHAARAGVLAAILVLLHLQHAERKGGELDRSAASLTVEDVLPLFPGAASLSEGVQPHGGRDVLDASGARIGYVLQTSPNSDSIIGFSGPTNLLIGFGADDRARGVRILSSGDTRDHVRQVREDDRFLALYVGRTRRELAAEAPQVDAVSGATLTSLAIQESVIRRLGGAAGSLRFPEPLTAEDALPLFPRAVEVTQDDRHESLWHVRDARGETIGAILRTAPTADNVVGYQGPTEARIAFGPDGRVSGLSLGKSYDNEPYVSYVREDEYFLTLFNGLVLRELAELDVQQAEVEGVSGATMTSMAVTQAMIVAAREHRRSLAEEAQGAANRRWGKPRDLGTALVVAAGLAIGLTSLRSHRWMRLGLQLVLIGYLGLINGDMLSQAMLVGWAQSGIPWRHAGGLVLLTAAALVVPLTTRRNVYCSHLCPHGAAQQLLKRRLPWQLHLSPRWSRVLKLVPLLLLAWCLLVGMLALPFSLVDIEPFDAWVFPVAGWATIGVAVTGLVASLFVPMAYCRFGCPTGAMLNFLRFHSRSGEWTARDGLACGLLLLAAGLWIAF